MKRKLKALLLHGEMSPYRLPLFESLAEKVDLDVYECQHRSGRRRWSISPDEYSFKSRLLKFFRMGPFIINYSLPFGLLSRRYEVYILGEDARIVFSECLVFMLAKLFRRPVIIWSGTTERVFYEKYKNIVNKYILEPLNKFIYRYADAFIAYGEQTKKCLLKKGVPPQKIYFGTQVLCTKELMSHAKDIITPSTDISFKNKLVILCVSYFDRRKGINYLIEAYKLLNRNDTVLILAGAGREEENLKLLANDRKDIYFPGYIEAKEKAYYYSIADIFVLPTLCDAWGLVVNEAMMFGLPVITTNEAGCAQELIKGNGFIVDAGNSLVLKEAMEKLLNDDNLRQQMGAVSKKIVKEFIIENAKKTFIDAIDYALKYSLIRGGNDITF